MTATPPPGPAKGSKERLIQTAMSAAPSSISANATLIDMHAKVDSLKVLRAGTNGWTCVPDDTTAHHMGPICADGQRMKWFEAWMARKPPVVTMVGTACAHVMVPVGSGGKWRSDAGRTLRVDVS